MASNVSKIELQGLLGQDGLTAILSLYGGQLIYVPKSPSPELVECLGEPGALVLCESYGGENISFPARGRLTLKEQIIPMIEQGLSHNQIAKALGCHWRHAAMVKQFMNGGKPIKKAPKPRTRDERKA